MKHRKALYNEKERLYMVSALKFVKQAFITKGHGVLDFKNEIQNIKPEIFFVNRDGDSLEKRQFIEKWVSNIL